MLTMILLSIFHFSIIHKCLAYRKFDQSVVESKIATVTSKLSFESEGDLIPYTGSEHSSYFEDYSDSSRRVDDFDDTLVFMWKKDKGGRRATKERSQPETLGEDFFVKLFMTKAIKQIEVSNLAFLICSCGNKGSTIPCIIQWLAASLADDETMKLLNHRLKRLSSIRLLRLRAGTREKHTHKIGKILPSSIDTEVKVDSTILNTTFETTEFEQDADMITIDINKLRVYPNDEMVEHKSDIGIYSKENLLGNYPTKKSTKSTFDVIHPGVLVDWIEKSPPNIPDVVRSDDVRIWRIIDAKKNRNTGVLTNLYKFFLDSDNTMTGCLELPALSIHLLNRSLSTHLEAAKLLRVKKLKIFKDMQCQNPLNNLPCYRIVWLLRKSLAAVYASNGHPFDELKESDDESVSDAPAHAPRIERFRNISNFINEKLSSESIRTLSHKHKPKVLKEFISSLSREIGQSFAKIRPSLQNITLDIMINNDIKASNILGRTSISEIAVFNKSKTREVSSVHGTLDAVVNIIRKSQETETYDWETKEETEFERLKTIKHNFFPTTDMIAGFDTETHKSTFSESNKSDPGISQTKISINNVEDNIKTILVDNDKAPAARTQIGEIVTINFTTQFVTSRPINQSPTLFSVVNSTDLLSDLTGTIMFIPYEEPFEDSLPTSANTEGLPRTGNQDFINKYYFKNLPSGKFSYLRWLETNAAKANLNSISSSIGSLVFSSPPTEEYMVGQAWLKNIDKNDTDKLKDHSHTERETEATTFVRPRQERKSKENLHERLNKMSKFDPYQGHITRNTGRTGACVELGFRMNQTILFSPFFVEIKSSWFVAIFFVVLLTAFTIFLELLRFQLQLIIFQKRHVKWGVSGGLSLYCLRTCFRGTRRKVEHCLRQRRFLCRWPHQLDQFDVWKAFLHSSQRMLRLTLLALILKGNFNLWIPIIIVIAFTKRWVASIEKKICFI